MENNLSEKTLGERLINVQPHGFLFLKEALIPLITFYIVLSPQTAAVFLIEYFKLDPTIALIILQLAIPVLVGIVIARSITIWWIGMFRYLFTFFLLVLTCLPLLPICLLAWLLALFKFPFLLIKIKKSAESTTERLNSMLIRLKQRHKKERKFLLMNQVIVVILVGSLLYAASFETIGRLWNPKFNKKLLIISNLHYYCQVTGSYNEDMCKKWKGERVNYEQSLSEKKTPNK